MCFTFTVKYTRQKENGKGECLDGWVDGMLRVTVTEMRRAGGARFKASEVLRRRNFAKTGEEIVKLAALKQ